MRSCGLQTRSVGPTVRSAGLLVGRTHLSGTVMSLVGGDPGVPMSHKGVKGYKYPTPKNMTVRPLTTTCPEDTTWRSELPGSGQVEPEDVFESFGLALSSDLEVVSSAPKES
jgi:hypothetical protein